MAEYLIQDATLIEIANAIRNKANKTDIIPVSSFAEEISLLKAGGEPPVLDKTLPADASYVTGKNVTCHVLIAGDAGSDDYTYQWYVNNVAVIGANQSSYTVNETSVGTLTVYCNVTNVAGTTSSRVATITVKSAIPTYTYSGTAVLTEEGLNTGNWNIQFKTSGTLKFTELGNVEDGIDVFLVGGGGGGSSGGWSGTDFEGRAGGGGGYTKTIKAIKPIVNTNYSITVGAGGSGGTGNSPSGGRGGTSSAFSNSVEGGYGGGNMNGGAGGSGGGAGHWNKDAGDGGSDGSAGGASNGWSGGSGQGTTTRAFGEPNGVLYAGGGGGATIVGTYSCRNGYGGAGGGASGECSASANTGGGGGGSITDEHESRGGTGGSGIVIIRNKR